MQRRGSPHSSRHRADCCAQSQGPGTMDVSLRSRYDSPLRTAPRLGVGDGGRKETRQRPLSSSLKCQEFGKVLSCPSWDRPPPPRLPLPSPPPPCAFSALAQRWRCCPWNWRPDFGVLLRRDRTLGARGGPAALASLREGDFGGRAAQEQAGTEELCRPGPTAHPHRPEQRCPRPPPGAARAAGVGQGGYVPPLPPPSFPPLFLVPPARSPFLSPSSGQQAGFCTLSLRAALSCGPLWALDLGNGLM